MAADGTVSIEKLETVDASDHAALCDLLTDAVRDGASVGFLWPLAPTTAREFWAGVVASLGSRLHLWVARSGGRVVGAIQLAPAQRENSRHRGEAQKLFVHTSHRGRGIAGQLMRAMEDHARASGLTLLVLDTISGSHAETIYRHLGWTCIGQIPHFAAMPDGEIRPTSVFYKLLK